MDTSNLIALVSTAIAAVSVALNVYQWRERGPKLVGLIIPVTDEFVPILSGAEVCIDFVVSNRGASETKITNVVMLCYSSWLDRWRRKIAKQATITQSPPKYDLSNKFGPGDDFRCRLDLSAELIDWTQNYRSYLCVMHTMSDRPAHFRLKAVATKRRQVVP